ncbi:hypothetical protein [Vibrio alfacsensis]|uniref:hypothetical protein n=1 Tax=Vibrio alfacsensis TaxID=1074311 RepID=UPI004067C346
MVAKANSSQATGEQRALAVREWLSTEPEIPLYQGRANQAEIGRMFNITKSTWGSNPKLKKIWSDIKKLAAKQVSGMESPKYCATDYPSDTRKLLKEKDQLIGWLRRELIRAEARIEMLQLESAAEEFLIETGRYVSIDKHVDIDCDHSLSASKETE